MDIYENPSEHYASINNYGVGIQHPRTGGEGKKEYEKEIKKIEKRSQRIENYICLSGYGAVNHAGQDGSASGPNFYGYGRT